MNTYNHNNQNHIENNDDGNNGNIDNNGYLQNTQQPSSMRFVLRSTPNESPRNNMPYRIHDTSDEDISNSNNNSNDRHPIYSLTNQQQPSDQNNPSDYIAYLDNKIKQLESETNLQSSFGYNYNNNHVNYNNNQNNNQTFDSFLNNSRTNSPQTPTPPRQESPPQQVQPQQGSPFINSQQSQQSQRRSTSPMIQLQKKQQLINLNSKYIIKTINSEIKEMESSLNWIIINNPTNEKEIEILNNQIQSKYLILEKFNEILDII